jgi:hypothetical protein
MAVNHEWVRDDRFQKQDLVRTISISFQPHIPFTEAYSMKLQGQGGGTYSSDPSKLGYFRLGPQDIEGSINPRSTAFDYPMKHKARIYNAEGVFPRATKMSMAHNRRQEAIDNVPDAQSQSSQSLLGRDLAALLDSGGDFYGENEWRVEHKVDGRVVRDKNELELHMINEFLDANIGEGMKLNIAGGAVSQADPLNEQAGTDKHFFTNKSSQTFDMDLREREHLRAFYYNQDQVAMGPETRYLEVSKEKPGGQKHALSRIDIRTKDAKKAKTKWAKNIKKYLKKLNHKMETQWRQLGINATSLGPYGRKAAAGILRSRFPTNTTAGSQNYEIRQAIDRFIKNNFNPYLDQHNFSFGMGTFRRVPEWTDTKGLQFDVSNIEGNIMIFQDVRDLNTALINTAAEENSTHNTTIRAKHGKIQIEAANIAISTEARLKKVDSYIQAKTVLDATTGSLQLGRVDEDGMPTTLHKVSTKIAEKMRKDIKARYDKKTPEFKEWYEGMMRESNRLTKSWFNNLLNVKGHGPTDRIKAGKNNSPASISEEFIYGADWKGPRKKYMGVWNPPTVDTWKGVKGTRGYNMSLSPMMESRRMGFTW